MPKSTSHRRTKQKPNAVANMANRRNRPSGGPTAEDSAPSGREMADRKLAEIRPQIYQYKYGPSPSFSDDLAKGIDMWLKEGQRLERQLMTLVRKLHPCQVPSTVPKPIRLEVAAIDKRLTILR